MFMINFYFFFLSSTILFDKITICAAIYTYPANCHPYEWKDHIDTSVKGNLLNCRMSHISETNSFTHIQTNLTLALRIHCFQVLNGRISEGKFKHLHLLRELNFEGCLLIELPDGMLDGLFDLLMFTVTNSFPKFGNILPSPMQISPYLFKPTPKLQLVEFTFTALNTIPDDLFCQTEDLKVLNLAKNELTSIDDIGCGYNNSCCFNLLILNMSSNYVDHLSSRSFHPMPLMKQLILSDNKITTIEDGCLDKLRFLLLFDVSFNKLSKIPSNLFSSSTSLQIILLNNNQLERIPPTLFQGLNFLFKLNLKWNKISDLDSSIFSDLHELHVLDLSNNYLQTLPEEIFKSNAKLIALGLENNGLLFLQANQFQLSTSLLVLQLSENKLSNLTLDFARYIQVLNISKNELIRVPEINFMRNLQYLDLKSNAIQTLDPGFQMNANLTHLDLGNNLINTINENHFKELLMLETLILSNNSLTSIENLRGCCPSLVNLDVSRNKLRNIDKSIVSFSSLKVINLTRNLLSNEIDFSSALPKTLENLDISHNNISILSNRLKKELRLNSLYAAYNKIERIIESVFPISLAYIDLSHNAISMVGAHIFAGMRSLKYIDFSSNKLSIIRKYSFTFPERFDKNTPLPIINLTNNTLICNCINDWIIKELSVCISQRLCPNLILDILCRVQHKRMYKFHPFLYLYKPLNTSQFFCSYEMDEYCPFNCNCYKTFDENIHQVDCGGYNERFWDSDGFPLVVTHLFLDDVLKVPWNLTANLPYLKSLFLNSSRISNLTNNRFSTLPALEELHLEDNELTEISSLDFVGLEKLCFLYLQNNFLVNIDPSAFSSMKSMKFLNLENNMLQNLNLVNVSIYLRNLNLANNSFQCTCEFVLPFRHWLTEQQVNVEKSNNTFCESENGTQIEFLSFNDTVCYPLKIRYQSSKNLTMLLLLIFTSTFLILAIALAILYLHRYELLVWLYARYGLRLFHGSVEDKTDKVYDAFISYSHEDEAYVANELVPQLNDYKLCLHQRDFLVGSFITESIVEAVQKSCRTILVISPYFARSEWCRFEFRTAHHQAIIDRCCRLIAIVLADVPPKNMEKELRTYMRTNTYLKCDDKNFFNKLKYALPDPERRNHQQQQQIRQYHNRQEMNTRC